MFSVDILKNYSLQFIQTLSAFEWWRPELKFCNFIHNTHDEAFYMLDEKGRKIFTNNFWLFGKNYIYEQEWKHAMWKLKLEKTIND